MNADGSRRTQLTYDGKAHLGPHWSPDGTKIVFVRGVMPNGQRVFVMNADGSGTPTQLTNVSPDNNGRFASATWGLVRVNAP
jgi:Tol biopolymer transport system component